jgi:RimJ/RimL family protein N-acetyltransferase
MVDARTFRTEDTLRNGARVTIRAARPDDRTRIANAFSKLERESVYTRFFSYKSELSDSELDQLNEMDFARDVMLVVTIADGGEETVIAGARYVGYDAGDGTSTAEIAFTVEEDYQGFGIAGRLLKHLITIGRGYGIARFEADVLAGNKAMLAVFERSGLAMRREHQGDSWHLTLSLGADAKSSS